MSGNEDGVYRSWFINFAESRPEGFEHRTNSL